MDKYYMNKLYDVETTKQTNCVLLRKPSRH